jgi:hypothetical protein
MKDPKAIAGGGREPKEASPRLSRWKYPVQSQRCYFSANGNFDQRFICKRSGASSAEGDNMDILTGPVSRRTDGYALTAWAADNGVTRGYPYHRIEDARFARNVEIGDHAYLAAKNPWLQCQLHAPLELGDRPFIVGRRPIAGEGAAAMAAGSRTR